jgi:hypothetical protein
MLKVYCEHNAITKELLQLKKDGIIEILHFPYDPNSTNRRISHPAKPSGAQMRDIGCTFEEIGNACFGEFVGSEYLEAIMKIIGLDNRRDALHVDSAYKSGCICMVTCDSDIWSKADRLEQLLGLRVFHKNDPKLVVFLRAKTDRY